MYSWCDNHKLVMNGRNQIRNVIFAKNTYDRKLYNMKKRIIMTAIVLVTSLMILTSCGNETYDKADNINEDYGNGYFTTIKKWGNSDMMYRIVYANDTGVEYMIAKGYYRFSITPLYNADGTLKIYEEEN